MDDVLHGGKQDILERKKFLLTANQLGLSKKQLMVPSFDTTAKIFGQHFLVMRELKHKIDLLKQAYYGQNDRKKTWEQVDRIVEVLTVGQHYLDFPLDGRIFLTAEDAALAGITGDAAAEAELAAADAAAALLSADKTPDKERSDDTRSVVSRGVKAKDAPEAIKEESEEDKA